MAGPASAVAAGWKLRRKGLSIDPESRVDSSGVTYLRCKNEKTSSKLAEGRLATVVAYNIEEYIE
eukprot:12257994-Alexandrium_andersonii.AAC.1